MMKTQTTNKQESLDENGLSLGTIILMDIQHVEFDVNIFTFHFHYYSSKTMFCICDQVSFLSFSVSETLKFEKIEKSFALVAVASSTSIKRYIFF